MNIETFTALATLFSRSFATGLSALLVDYSDISASEAASRLDLHIKTVQDWLEGMFELGILKRHEVSEGKRPYFRYSLNNLDLDIHLNLSSLSSLNKTKHLETARIREKKNANTQFSTSARTSQITSISVFTGRGRNKKERKLNLNPRQGTFIYHLPFPTAEHEPVRHIMQKAGLRAEHMGEIADIVSLLIDLGVVERLS